MDLFRLANYVGAIGGFCGVMFSYQAQAKSSVPSRSLSTGPVFPSLNDSLLLGPETLPFSPGQAALNAFSDLALSNYGLSVAYASTSFGVGLGYSTNVPYASGAFRYSKISAGTNVRLSTNGGSSQIGFGLGYGDKVGANYILYFPNLFNLAPTLGIGYIELEKYNLEISFELPPLTSFFNGLSQTRLGLGTAVYFGIFGVAFTATNSLTSVSTPPAFTLGLRVNPLKKIHITALVSNGGTMSLGAIIGF